MAGEESKAFPGVIGNSALKERLYHDVVSGSLSHAYIIDGKKGSGRHTLALNLCASLSCRKKNDENAVLPCGICNSCRKILEGKSPDVIYISRGDRATLGVESIRFIKNDVFIAPNDTDVKIYIIEDAETMTVQAQNAFLLTLEEPPAYVLFLLLCDGVDGLLETIKSRAPVLRMEPIAKNMLKDYLLADADFKSAVPASEVDEIILASEGRIGVALDFADKKKRNAIIKQRETVKTFLASCVKSKDKSNLIEAIRQFGNKRDEIMCYVDLSQKALRDLMLLKKSDRAELIFYTDRDEAMTMADNFTSANLMSIFDGLTDIKEMILRNANTKLIMMQLLLCASGE